MTLRVIALFQFFSTLFKFYSLSLPSVPRPLSLSQKLTCYFICMDVLPLYVLFLSVPDGHKGQESQEGHHVCHMFPALF